MCNNFVCFYVVEVGNIHWRQLATSTSTSFPTWLLPIWSSLIPSKPLSILSLKNVHKWKYIQNNHTVSFAFSKTIILVLPTNKPIRFEGVYIANVLELIWEVELARNSSRKVVIKMSWKTTDFLVTPISPNKIRFWYSCRSRREESRLCH